MGYSIKHKMLILQKVLPPNNRAVHEVSKETGISVPTIYKWMQQVKDDTLEPGAIEEQIPRFKSDLEKFSLIIESKSVPEAEMSVWLIVSSLVRNLTFQKSLKVPNCHAAFNNNSRCLARTIAFI